MPVLRQNEGPVRLRVMPGQVLNIVAPVGSSAYVVHLIDMDPAAVVSGASQAFGPYAGVKTLTITCTAGAITYDENAAPASAILPASALTAQDVAGAQYPLANVALNGASLDPFLKAVAKVLAGERVRVLCYGDSTTAGQGAATGTSGFFGAKKKTWASQMAAALTALGIPANNDSVMGTNGVASTYTEYNPEVTTSAGFVRNGLSGVPGGSVWQSSAAGDTWAIKPSTRPYDRVTVIFIASAGISASADSNGTAAGTLTGSGTNTLTSTTLTVPRGVGNDRTTTLTASAANFFIAAVIPWDSTVGAFDFIQAGQPGARMADFAVATSPWNWSNPAIHAAIGAELGILEATINDTSVTTPAAYTASLVTVDSAFAAQGTTLLLASGIPPSTASKPEADRRAIVAAMAARATATGRVFIDQDGFLGGYDRSNSLGQMYDQLHGNGRLYGRTGKWRADVLKRLAQG